MEKGLRYDRRWMLVDENNVFMTQRDFHSMALFKVSFSPTGFKIHFKSDFIDLPFDHDISDSPIQTVIWDDTVTVAEVKGDYSKWFSDRLEMKCKLVFFPEENPRPVDPEYKLIDEHVSLADGYPLIIIGQSSLNDLNGRLDKAVPMNRFRPNLVFTGGEAFEEDYWKKFRVGKNNFIGVKKCARCILTTVNQDTGEKGREPLLTLSGYRRVDTKIFFGQNVIAIDHNEIHEGDEITFE